MLHQLGFNEWAQVFLDWLFEEDPPSGDVVGYFGSETVSNYDKLAILKYWPMNGVFYR